MAGGVIGALNSDALTSGKKKPMQAVAGKIFGAAGYINNVANIPTNAVNAMIAAANPAGTATATIGNVLGAGAKAVFGKGGLNLTGGIGAVAGKLGGGFMSLLGTFGPAITSLGTMVAVVSLLGDHFEDVRNIVGQIFGEGGLAVFDQFTGKISGIGDTIKQVFGQLTTPEGLQSIQQKLSGFNIGGLNLGDVFGAAMPAIQTVMPLIQSFAGVMAQIVDLGVNHIKPLLVEIFGFVVNQGIPAVMPLLSTVVSLVGTILVNAIKTVVDVIGKLLPVAEPVVLGIIGLVKGIVGVVVNVVNAIIRTLNKINFTVPDWVPALGGKQFGFNLTEVTLPKFADGGFTNGPSLAGEAGTEAIISFRRSQREQNIDTWMQAGKMLGVPIASAMIQGSDFGVAFRRTTELANYAADALEGAAASGNATAQKVLDNSRVQQALSFARRADVAQAQLERLSDLDGYDLSNLTFFPTAGDAALTRQNLAMLETCGITSRRWKCRPSRATMAQTPAPGSPAEREAISEAIPVPAETPTFTLRTSSSTEAWTRKTCVLSWMTGTSGSVSMWRSTSGKGSVWIMALEYTTKSGDTWDQIAYTVYGSELKADWLMQANPEYIEFTRFDSGLVLSTPALPAEKSGTLPPWKAGA